MEKNTWQLLLPVAAGSIQHTVVARWRNPLRFLGLRCRKAYFELADELLADLEYILVALVYLAHKQHLSPSRTHKITSRSFRSDRSADGQLGPGSGYVQMGMFLVGTIATITSISTSQ